MLMTAFDDCQDKHKVFYFKSVLVCFCVSICVVEYTVVSSAIGVLKCTNYVCIESIYIHTIYTHKQEILEIQLFSCLVLEPQHCTFCMSLSDCNDWSKTCGSMCSEMVNRQNQTGKGQQAKTGISEAGQRHKQYQAEVGVTGTGSEFQGRAVRGQTQR